MDKEIIILTETQKAANKLAKITVELTKAVEGVTAYTEAVEDLTDQINLKTVELSKLEEEYVAKVETIATDTKERIAKAEADFKEQRRAAKVNMDLDIKADEDAAFNSLLVKRNQVAVSSAYLENLEKELADASKSNQDAIDAAVAKQQQDDTKELERALSNVKLQYAAESAKNIAQLETADRTIELLSNQLKDANEQISKMRETMEAMITKQAGPVINLAGK